MSVPIHRILFATDLSSKARGMFRYAATIAAHHCAGLVILHVLQEAPKKETLTLMISNLLGEERWKQLREQDAQAARSVLIGKKTEADKIRSAAGALCTFMQERHPEVRILEDDILAVQGPVAETIVRTAKDSGCDLIVMGYHRRSGLADAVAGSTLKAVLRLTRTPVLLVPPPEDAA
jgi:nucleotide-binding universal stress UspA family protein